MRWVVKIALLALYALITFHLFSPQDRIPAWIIMFGVLFIGVLSLDKQRAIHGDGKDPGMLSVFSCFVPVVISLMFYLDPVDTYNDVYKVDFIKNFPDWLKTSRIFMSFFVSAYLLFYIWVPLLLYERVDKIAARWKRNTESIV